MLVSDTPESWFFEARIFSLDDAKEEMIRMEELEQARKEVEKTEGPKELKQNMFRTV